MLIQCTISIQDLSSGQSISRPLRSCVMTKKVNDEYFVCLKNSLFPNIKNYKLTMLQNIYRNYIKDGKMGLEFIEPKEVLLLTSSDKRMIYMFFRHIKNIMEGRNVFIGQNKMPKKVPAKNDGVNRFDPLSLQFVAIKRFDNRILNMRHLSTLVLENCNLQTLPEQMGHLPIKYLSISGSKLPTSQNQLDVFWNWTSMITICNSLTTLKMDSINLDKLPFEIFFLKNLEALSACNNNLKYLPQLIGGLKKLKSLYIADNYIVSFPHGLASRTFNEIDLSNNSFQIPRSIQLDHIARYLEKSEIVMVNDYELDVKPLIHLAFSKILETWIPFKRQDIPRTMWLYFEVVGCCMLCCRWILPDYCQLTHTYALPTAINLIKDHKLYSIPWQSFICRNSDECERQYMH